MPDKLYISDLTWRTDKEQSWAMRFIPSGTVYRNGQRDEMLRPSQRKTPYTIHVASLAVLSDKEKDFIGFAKLARKRHATISSREEACDYHPTCDINELIKDWRKARVRGAAKAGGDAKSSNSFLKFWDGFSKIKDRWHLDENSKGLMKEAGIKHHDTIRANLGHTRWEWRSFSDAKRARVLKQLEKEVRECQKKQ